MKQETAWGLRFGVGEASRFLKYQKRAYLIPNHLIRDLILVRHRTDNMEPCIHNSWLDVWHQLALANNRRTRSRS
jgi:hypothetical protein